MSILAIVGLILAVINPVIGGVLVGYIVWLSDKDMGFQIILLAFFIFSLYVIGYIIWNNRNIKKLESTIKSMQSRD